MSKNFKIVTAIAVQLLIVLLLVIFKVAALNSGTQVLLKLAPIDPRDPLRGDYLNLRYDITTVNKSSSPQTFSNGDVVYVPLEKSGAFWIEVPTGLQKSLPAQNSDGIVYIKGTVMSGGNASPYDVNNYYYENQNYQIKYNIESYYVPEGLGNTWRFNEMTNCQGDPSCMNSPQNQTFAAVMVADNGEAILKQLYVNDKPWPQGGTKLQLTNDSSTWTSPAPTTTVKNPESPLQ